MATNATETTTDDQATEATQAETAAAGSGGATTTHAPTMEELQAERDRLKRALNETNRKALADRKRIEEIDRERAQQEDAKLGEADRLRKTVAEREREAAEAKQRTADLEAQLTTIRIDRAIERAAAGLFVNPELAPKLVDRDLVTEDPDQPDKVVGAKEAVERLLKKYPDLGLTRRGGGSPAAMPVRRPASAAGSTGDNDRLPTLREFVASKVGVDPM